jgi:hypothetical protein
MGLNNGIMAFAMSAEFRPLIISLIELARFYGRGYKV